MSCTPTVLPLGACGRPQRANSCPRLPADTSVNLNAQRPKPNAGLGSYRKPAGGRMQVLGAQKVARPVAAGPVSIPSLKKLDGGGNSGVNLVGGNGGNGWGAAPTQQQYQQHPEEQRVQQPHFGQVGFGPPGSGSGPGLGPGPGPGPWANGGGPPVNGNGPYPNGPQAGYGGPPPPGYGGPPPSYGGGPPMAYGMGRGDPGPGFYGNNGGGMGPGGPQNGMGRGGGSGNWGNAAMGGPAAVGPYPGERERQPMGSNWADTPVEQPPLGAFSNAGQQYQQRPAPGALQRPAANGYVPPSERYRASEEPVQAALANGHHRSPGHGPSRDYLKGQPPELEPAARPVRSPEKVKILSRPALPGPPPQQQAQAGEDWRSNHTVVAAPKQREPERRAIQKPVQQSVQRPIQKPQQQQQMKILAKPLDPRRVADGTALVKPPAGSAASNRNAVQKPSKDVMQLAGDRMVAVMRQHSDGVNEVVMQASIRKTHGKELEFLQYGCKSLVAFAKAFMSDKVRRSLNIDH